MIVRTEAIVLRSIDYGETSEIVTVFTRDMGKLTVMAKGARRPKSRFGSTLQPMSYTEVVFYYKETRGIQTLTESSHVRAFHGISRSLEGLSYGLRIVELVYALMQEEERNPIVFDLVLEILEELNRTATRLESLFHFFQLRLATVLGFAPHIEREDVERIPESGGVIALEDGSILPTEPGGAITVRRGSRKALRAFAIFARADLETVMRMRVDKRTHIELSRLIEDFIRYHVEDAYPSRSARIIGQMLDDT
ncbi:MAG: DNA repair protein RecO [Rhodothermales bacterium]